MKKALTMFAAIAATFALATLALADKDKTCGKCPISGKPAKDSVAADYLGKKVYFCCEGCPEAFTKDVKKFAAKANHQLLVTGQMVQVGCPFSGGPVNPKTVVNLDGAEFGFCCEKCQAKCEKADDSVALVFASIAKGFTTQTACPVSGKPINPKHSLEHAGKKVYFCCGGCPAAFQKDPAKFESKLPKE